MEELRALAQLLAQLQQLILAGEELSKLQTAFSKNRLQNRMYVHPTPHRQIQQRREREPTPDQQKGRAGATIITTRDLTTHPQAEPTTAAVVQDLLPQHEVHVHRVRIVAAAEEDDKTLVYRPFLSWPYLTCVFTGFGLFRRIGRSLELWR